MDNKIIQRSLIVLSMIAFSVLMATFMPGANFGSSNIAAHVNLLEESIIEQSATGLLETSSEVVKVYDAGKLIGVVHDYDKIENLLDEVYREEYEENFPDTILGLDEDVYISTELSTLDYEDIDDKICAYLKNTDSFSIETNRIEFNDGKGVYATIYVRDIEDFYDARDSYLLNFISEETLKLIGGNKQIPELTTYGSREMGINIQEEMIVSKGLASPSKIMTSTEEVLMYLSYGEDTTPEIYVVEEFDTVEGVGSKSEYFLSAEQVVAINPGVLTSVDQVLEVGTELNIRYFDSPITIEVTKELVSKEIVYPGPTEYYPDDTLREGMSYVTVYEANGSKNVRYEETWINGVLTSATEVSSIITHAAVNRVEYYGSKYIAGVGTGTYIWPVRNPRVSCGWYCYSGHRAVDIVNMYDRYGYIYAADRGEVIENTYNSAGGYYTIIDHNNGYVTYYGHMKSRGYIPVGANVEKGEVIGQIGMTGYATGPHVHFYVETSGGSRSNPLNYLP